MSRLLTWFRKSSFSRPSAQGKPPPRRLRPQLEILEDRLVPAGSPLSNLPPIIFTVVQPDYKLLASGLDSYLNGVGSSLNAIDPSNPLPVVNRPLTNLLAGDWDSIRTVLFTTLNSFKGQTNPFQVGGPAISQLLQNALFNALGPSGSNALGYTHSHSGAVDASDVVVSALSNGGKDVSITLHLLKSFLANPDFGLALPGVPFATTSHKEVRANLTLDYDQLTFGIQNGRFFVGPQTPVLVKTGLPGIGIKILPSSTFTVTVDATLIPGARLTGTLGLLPFTATNDPAHPTSFHGVFQTVVAGTNLTAVRLDGTADVNLKVSASLGGPVDPSFPSFRLDLHEGWVFKGANPTAPFASFGSAPAVSYNNVTVNLGSIVSNVLSPWASRVQSVTGPLQPVIDVLTKPIPGLSDLSHKIGQGDITLLGLAQYYGSNGQLATDLAQAIQWGKPILDVINLINHMSIPAANQVIVNYGNFDLAGNNVDLRTLAPAGDVNGGQAATRLIPDYLNPTDINSVKNQLARIAQQGGTAGTAAGQLKTYLDSFSYRTQGIDFPIISDPRNSMFRLFLGQDADLATFTTDLHVNENIDFSASLPGVTAGVGGPLLIDGHLKIGYDTAGLREYLRHGAVNTHDLLAGFYVDDATHLTIQTNLAAKAGLGIGVGISVFGIGAFATVNGGVSTGNGGTAPVTVTLHDPNQNGDGKLHLNEAGPTLFDTAGEIDAGLSLHVKAEVKAGPFHIQQDTTILDIASTKLIDLNGRSIPNPF